MFRQIEINWLNAPLDDNNAYIGLYLDSQPEGDYLPVSVHRLNNQKSGQIITDYYLPQLDFYNETSSSEIAAAAAAIANPRNGWAQSAARRRILDTNDEPNSREQALNDECVGYCLALHSNMKIIARNCLKTNPNWMLESFNFIKSRSISWLMIPGTHNSATYARELDKSALQIVNKYQLNQDESIFNQLIYGIRHLDLRVGYHKVKNRADKFWIYHDIFRTEVSLIEVFQQVRKFLQLTSHELIVMDFHRFTVGFEGENLAVQRDRHAKLLGMLYGELGQYLVPSYMVHDTQIGDYIAMGKRLIVGYANREKLGHGSVVGSEQLDHYVEFLGPPVRHLWPNKDTLEGLSQYMNKTTCRKYFGDLRSMMVELTPTVFGVISDKYDGNRRLAQLVNRPVTDWIRDRWLHCVNIVASDFFLGNDLIQLSIDSNRMRALRGRPDIKSYGLCKSFRQVEHLLDKSKIPLQFIYHDPQEEVSKPRNDSQSNRTIDSNLKIHTSSDGTEIHVKLLVNSPNIQTIDRPKKDSFVDNISDGFSSFISSVKRLLNI